MLSLGSSYLVDAKCATSDSSGQEEADDVLKKTSSSKGIDDAAIVDCRGYSSHGRLRWRFDTDRKSEPSPRANPCTRSCGSPSSGSEHRFSWWRLLVEVHFCGLCLQRSNAKYWGWLRQCRARNGHLQQRAESTAWNLSVEYHRDGAPGRDICIHDSSRSHTGERLQYTGQLLGQPLMDRRTLSVAPRLTKTVTVAQPRRQ